MGSVISASEDTPSLPTAASSGIVPGRVVRILSREIKADEAAFSERLFRISGAEEVDTLLTTFREFEPAKQQSTLKAVVVMAIGVLEGAGRVDQTVLWTTVRLADFLLGNCLLPATHVWLDGDSQRLTYLRKPATARSVMDDGRSVNLFLPHLAQGFMAGAKAFGQTYCDFYDFILAQKAFDARHIFGDATCMPTLVDIFNRAVAQNWKPVEMDHAGEAEAGAAEERGGRDEDHHSATHHSATGSTSTIGTIAAGAVLRTLSAKITADTPIRFADRLFADPTRGATVSLDELLGEYNRLDDAGRSEVLKAVVVRAVDFLHGADADRNPQAWWVTARLAGFLLGNRLLPPLHGWLDGVNVDIDDDTPANVSALVHLMAPRTGMLHTAMISLIAGGMPQEEAGGSTIFELTRMFKDVAVSFDGAYREIYTMSRTQYHRDRAGLSTRIMPSILEVFNRAAQMVLAARERESERGRDEDSRSPVRAQARTALMDDTSTTTAAIRPYAHGLLGADDSAAQRVEQDHVVYMPTVSGDSKAPLLTRVEGSVNRDRGEDDTPPKRGFLYWITCGCCC